MAFQRRLDSRQSTTAWEGAETRAPDPNYAEIAQFYDAFAEQEDAWLERTGGYHSLVRSIYRSLVPAGQRVLEIGCGRGDLLAALEPSRGLGIDVSPGMIAAAQARHPELEFACEAGEQLRRDETFDYVIFSDLVPYVDDLQVLFARIAEHCHPRSRIILNTYSNVWRPLLASLSFLGLRPERPIRNWVAPRDLANLAELAGWELVAERKEMLLPVRIPLLSWLANGILARLPGPRALALTHWIVARPRAGDDLEYGVSVIVPCRNEAGSIPAIVERVPDMGRATEIIFVEGGSTDRTRQRIREEIARRPDRDLSLIVQSGKGKHNAVREGFAAAKHDVLMILDGDLTVAPEDLTKFYEAIVTGRGELINGMRLVYGMERGAMRFLNMVGNQFFAWLLSFVLGQYVKDTLCGTKVLHRDDYERLARQQRDLLDRDPYGDFVLLLGAALLGLKVSNIPVRYGARIYGDTNIQRFSGGRMLFKLALAGYRRIWLDPVAR